MRKWVAPETPKELESALEKTEVFLASPQGQRMYDDKHFRDIEDGISLMHQVSKLDWHLNVGAKNVIRKRFPEDLIGSILFRVTRALERTQGIRLNRGRGRGHTFRTDYQLTDFCGSEEGFGRGMIKVGNTEREVRLLALSVVEFDLYATGAGFVDREDCLTEKSFWLGLGFAFKDLFPLAALPSLLDHGQKDLRDVLSRMWGSASRSQRSVEIFSKRVLGEEWRTLEQGAKTCEVFQSKVKESGLRPIVPLVIRKGYTAQQCEVAYEHRNVKIDYLDFDLLRSIDAQLEAVGVKGVHLLEMVVNDPQNFSGWNRIHDARESLGLSYQPS